jgi:hypothetical protein
MSPVITPKGRGEEFGDLTFALFSGTVKEP